MKCFRNKEFIKTTEADWLRIMPLGEGKTVQLINKSKDYPDGIVTKGSFFYKKEKGGIYCSHHIKGYNKKTFKKEFEVTRNTKHYIDKNGIHHIDVHVGNAHRSGAITSISDSSIESIIYGSVFHDSKHYESKKVVYKRLNEKTCQKTVIDLNTNQLVYYVLYFYK